MIGDILQPTHLIFVLVVALLVLGPKRLPEAGRALGKGIRDFKSAIGGEEDHSSGLPTEAAPAPPPEAMVPPAAGPPVESTPGPSDTTAEQAETETVHPVG
jgi:sec-independent protein translocase protein TatA